MEKVESFFGSKLFKNLQVVPGAKEAVARLREKFILVVVTSRQLYIKEQTQIWLEENFPHAFSNVYFGNHWTRTGNPHHGKHRSKLDLCREAGAAALVDDQPKYIEECAEELEASILFNLHDSYEWTRHYQPNKPKTRKCTTWPQVVEELELQLLGNEAGREA
eukprot:GHVT01012939.1.p1 GENE.GHVT01012939.1~~GHVT01012939.1.p1  ORF type:complete len:163 (+),score=22.11 GHVT01012939.1:312-800(+)